jgi:hypothetical protein
MPTIPKVSLTSSPLARLAAMDLSMILAKAQHPLPEGLGWSDTQCTEAETWYRRFWHLILLYPDQRFVPNKPIDDLWHLHILDTAAYRRDCDAVLGYFLDHYPYWGIDGDAAGRDAAFDHTNHLYRSVFGSDCRSMVAFRTDASVCGGGGGRCGIGLPLVSAVLAAHSKPSRATRLTTPHTDH